MSNTVMTYDLSYESDDYPKLIAALTAEGLPFPASEVLHGLTFGTPKRWMSDLVEHTLTVDRTSCQATVISVNLVA
jgi:hypothetical protein